VCRRRDETDDVLTTFVRELATAPIFAEVSIDTAWLRDLKDMIARAVVEQFLRYNGFVVAGIAANRGSGTDTRLIYLRPETWHTTETPAHPALPSEVTSTQHQSSPKQGSFAGTGHRLGIADQCSEYVDRTAAASRSSTRADVGCHDASCRALVAGARPTSTQFSLLDAKSECGIGQVSSGTQFKFHRRVHRLPWPASECQVTTDFDVCVCEGHVCIKPTRVHATVCNDETFLVHKVILQFAVVNLSGTGAPEVGSYLFDEPNFPWKASVTAERPYEHGQWNAGGQAGLNWGFFNFNWHAERAPGPGNEQGARTVVKCGVRSSVSSQADFRDGTLCIWRDREVTLLPADMIRRNVLDTMILQGRPAGAEGVFPVGNRFAFQTRDSVDGLTELGVLVAMSLYAYHQNGSSPVEVNGSDSPLWSTWDVRKLSGMLPPDVHQIDARRSSV
jgi:hypothetical protein